MGESLVREHHGDNMAGRRTRIQLGGRPRKKKSVLGKVLKHEAKKIWTGKG